MRRIIFDDFKEWVFLEEKEWVITNGKNWLTSFSTLDKLPKRTLNTGVKNEYSPQLANTIRYNSAYEIRKNIIPKLLRRETWDEIVKRNMNMHIKTYPQLKKRN